MIIKGLFNLVLSLLQIIFAPINLPDLPIGLQSIFDGLLSAMLSAIGLFEVFVRPSTLQLLIPIVIVLVNFEKLWNGIMFILKKIPFLGIE